MGVEVNDSALFLSGLNVNWPDGATEVRSQGDNHLRLIKRALQNTFPNVTGAITVTQQELNRLAGLAVNVVDLVFATGTKLVFAQAAAPAGWTQDASNDRVLRVVSGAGGGVGGSLSITAATSGGTALSVAQLPAHSHTVNDPGHAHGFTGALAWAYTNAAGQGNTGSWAGSTHAAATGISINNTGSGSAHDHALAFKYQDVIICTKD